VNAVRTTLRWVLVAFFAVAGFNHFRDPATYLGMMPPWLPWPDLLQRIAGAAEMAGAVGLALPPLRRAAGFGLILLLIAVFPANLHVAMQGHMPGFDLSPTVLWLRLPFQVVFIAAVWWVALGRRGRVQIQGGPTG
jgi:uncharacterized membrane protein